MSLFTDRGYLLSDQYKNASNLDARIQLHRRFSTNPYGLMLWLFEHLQLGAGAHILDLGCGPGSLWDDNRARIPPGWEITLSDFSAGMIHQARDKLRQRFAYAVGDAQAIPFKGETFDAVIANFMLYHVPDRPRAFAEIHRVLKPGGRLFAATNGQDHMRELREMIAAVDPEAEMAGSAYSSRLSCWFSKMLFSPVTLSPPHQAPLGASGSSVRGSTHQRALKLR